MDIWITVSANTMRMFAQWVPWRAYRLTENEAIELYTQAGTVYWS
jgi:hypothetical protein